MTTLAQAEAGRMMGPNYNWLWEIEYEFIRLERNKYDQVSHHKDTNTYHVIAGTEAAARFAWWSNYNYSGTHKILSCRCLLIVDGRITVNGGLKWQV